MKTECPFCRQHYEVDAEFVDKVVECPQCKEEFYVQPIKTEQAAVKPPQITLPPIFANKPSAKTPAANTKSNNLLDHDPAEDNFVLKGIKVLKIINIVSAVIIVFLLFILAVVNFYNKKSSVGMWCLLITIPVLYHYFIANLALSWCRGIYRNLMQVSFLQAQLAAKLKQ